MQISASSAKDSPNPSEDEVACEAKCLHRSIWALIPPLFSSCSSADPSKSDYPDAASEGVQGLCASL